MPPKVKDDRISNYYAFIVAIDLFSRYAFVKLGKLEVIDKKDENKVDEEDDGMDVIENTEDDVDDLPVVEAAAMDEQKEELGKNYRIASGEVKIALEEWIKTIKDKFGADIANFITDDGGEYKGDVIQFLKDNDIHKVITVPNDRVKNPVAERFIGTFKRLVGQYLATTGKKEISQEDIDAIVGFYNNRVHSSTNFTPSEVLNDVLLDYDGEVIKDEKKFDVEVHDLNTPEEIAWANSKISKQSTLVNLYRYQKGQMYYDFDLEAGDTLELGLHCRIYTKWNLVDKNKGDKKQNRFNWSYTIFKIIGINKKDNMYNLQMIKEKDVRDGDWFNFPPEQGMRRELLQVIDWDAYQRYAI